MEAAAKFGGPMIVQFSRGGGQFGGASRSAGEPDKASVAGCVGGRLQVRQLAELYGVPVILHTDHCARRLPCSTACSRCVLGVEITSMAWWWGPPLPPRPRRWRFYVPPRRPLPVNHAGQRGLLRQERRALFEHMLDLSEDPLEENIATCVEYLERMSKSNFC